MERIMNRMLTALQGLSFIGNWQEHLFWDVFVASILSAVGIFLGFLIQKRKNPSLSINTNTSSINQTIIYTKTTHKTVVRNESSNDSDWEEILVYLACFVGLAVFMAWLFQAYTQWFTYIVIAGIAVAGFLSGRLLQLFNSTALESGTFKKRIKFYVVATLFLVFANAVMAGIVWYSRGSSKTNIFSTTSFDKFSHDVFNSGHGWFMLAQMAVVVLIVLSLLSAIYISSAWVAFYRLLRKGSSSTVSSFVFRTVWTGNPLYISLTSLTTFLSIAGCIYLLVNR